MNAVWLHLRSSTGRWAFFPLSVLGIAILFGRSRFWIGIWPETGAAAQVSGLFLSYFAAGMAAWTAAQGQLRGLHEQFAAAARKPFRIEVARFATTLLWLLAPYVVVAGVAFGATASTLPPGIGMYFPYMLLGIVILVLAAAWGWLVGRLLTPRLAAVCALLSWFILASVIAESTNAVRMAGPPWLEVSLTSVGLRMAATLAFAAAVCALPWRSVGHRLRLSQAVFGLAAVLGLIAAHATNVVSYREPVSKPLCVRGAIKYCLWPEHAKYVPLVKAVDARVAALPAGLTLPDRVVDYALSGSTRWLDLDTSIELEGDFPPEFDISEGSPWALARGVARAIEENVFAECKPNTVADARGHEQRRDPERRRDQFFAWLEWRLAGGGTPDYTTNAGGALQQAWATGHTIAAERSEHDQAEWATTLIGETKARFCRAG
ncbi:hypothetical protein ACGF5C_31080 [Micromonospora sp. NPDC047620]|uniref:hypothetical protein n=1 Tax=Micromonospora sp. NPDC047620 TaxID=3364251 RepID=UPI00371F60CE